MTHLLDEDFYKGAENLKEKIKTVGSTPAAKLIDWLATARDALRRIKPNADAVIDELIPSDIKERLAEVAADRKALEKTYSMVEEKTKEQLLKILERDKTLPEESPNGTTLTIQTRRKYTMIDPELTVGKIPEQFRLPVADCIDWEKVEAASKEGKLPKFAKEDKNFILVTKLDEEIV